MAAQPLRSVAPRRAVILAAGDGTRLGCLTRTYPKPLLRIGGRPIIDHVLAAVAAAGIQHVTVVIGYRGDQIRDYLGDGKSRDLAISYVWNPRYLDGNALSLAAAAQELIEPFLLMMGDHLLCPKILRVLAAGPASHALAVDRAPLPGVQSHEATKVQITSDGSISRIGKSLAGWDGLDTGAFRLQPSIRPLLAGGRYQEISELMTAIIAGEEGLQACDVSGANWLDLDTAADLGRARNWLDVHDRCLH